MGYMIQNDGDEHWHSSRINSVKINSDASIFEDLNCYSHASVVGDHEGKLIGARSKYLRGQINPES